MPLKAIVFGATGMVGEGVLHECLNHPDVSEVRVVGRRTCTTNHPKLSEVLHSNFYDFTTIRDRLTGYNACFFCLGVTSIGKNEQEYTRLTYDLTMAAARVLAEANPEMVFCYVSGTGTDSSEKGSRMWARVKGKTENDLTKLPFRRVYLFRPGFIRPTPGLKNAYGASKVLGLFYPLLRRLFPGYVCTLQEIGLAMIRVCLTGYRATILENRDIHVAGASDRGTSA